MIICGIKDLKRDQHFFELSKTMKVSEIAKKYRMSKSGIYKSIARFKKMKEFDIYVRDFIHDLPVGKFLAKDFDQACQAAIKMNDRLTLNWEFYDKITGDSHFLHFNNRK